MTNSVIPQFDSDLIRRLDRNGPRYTSYPTADRFTEAFDASAYAAWQRRSAASAVTRPLSLYVHIPFCNTICFYCGCNKVVTRNRARASEYLSYLTREARLHNALLSDTSRVEQLHLGGGTPTYLDLFQLGQLMDMLRAHFRFSPKFEGSIEIDPRSVSTDTIHGLRELGFDRVSFGVQDFDPAVQQAVNRIQPLESSASALSAARAAGFRSVNIDLIYGLPKQSLESVAQTLREVVNLRPDRIAFYSYAHLPMLFKSQRRILESDLPAPAVKLAILGDAIRTLTSAGYVHIGMDHFALADDELAVAQRKGQLHRNFQGYSTHSHCDLVGLGASAIGMIGPTYYQNQRTLNDYYTCLERGELPIMRGIALSPDDLVRRTVIQALMCHFQLVKHDIEIPGGFEFERYFSQELQELAELANEGLLTLEDDMITVTARGRLLIRPIAMVFDAHLRADQERRRYSKVI